jgi:hypothetical protein
MYTKEYHSATVKNEMMSFAGQWMELENFMLSEVNQVQKQNSCMISLICGV